MIDPNRNGKRHLSWRQSVVLLAAILLVAAITPRPRSRISVMDDSLREETELHRSALGLLLPFPLAPGDEPGDGDGWAVEVPLGEAREVYRVEILSGATVVRSLEVETPALVYTAAQRAADLAVAPGAPLVARIAQGSAAWGWGPARTIQMW